MFSVSAVSEGIESLNQHDTSIPLLAGFQSNALVLTSRRALFVNVTAESGSPEEQSPTAAILSIIAGGSGVSRGLLGAAHDDESQRVGNRNVCSYLSLVHCFCVIPKELNPRGGVSYSRA